LRRQRMGQNKTRPKKQPRPPPPVGGSLSCGRVGKTNHDR
jgi:hypothetical protein